MNKETIRIKFDGPALSNHCMDVSLLGPSLTGLGELLRASNRKINGGDIGARVLMNADIDANCVTMEFTIALGFFDHVKSLLGSEEVKTAEQILTWLGFITGAGVGVWKLYQWLVQNKKPGEKMIVTHGPDSVIISIPGSNNSLTVNNNVYKLAQDSDVQSGMKSLLAPLQEDGVNDATFIHDKQEVVIPKDAASAIIESTPADLDAETEPQIIVGHIVIYGPILDPQAKNWKFKWNDRVEQVDISKSNIATRILQRGKVVIGDAFKVRMEISEKKLKSGYKQYFRVIEVIEFVPTAEQIPLHN